MLEGTGSSAVDIAALAGDTSRIDGDAGSTPDSDPALIVEELIHGRSHTNSLSSPQGLANITGRESTQTQGAESLVVMDAGGIPGAINQLPFTSSQVYDLSVTAAAQLSIPIVGSVAGGYNRRVVVLERAAYAKVPVAEGQALYGYALRLAITISKRDANTKLSLPFLAASAEVGLIEARWMLQVVGLAGGEMDRISLAPTELSVETFVLAKQSLISLIGAVHHSSTHFLPQQIGLEQSPTHQERRVQQAIGTAFALGCLERRWDLQRAQSALSMASDEARDVLVDTYDKFAGIQSLSDRPSEAVQRKARETLGSVRVDPR